MNLFMKYIEHKKNEQIILTDNHTDIEEINQKMLKRLLLIGALSFSILFGLTFVLENYTKLRTPYCLMLIVLILFWGFVHTNCSFLPSAYFIYTGYGILVLYSTYTSAILTPNYVCVTILVFLFQMPIITLDKNMRINLIEITFALIYIIFALPSKNPEIISDEIVNIILFVVSSIALGQYLRKTRLDNFELKRQALIRETTDFLTRLYNRRKLFEVLEEQKKSLSSSIGIVMIDIDYFKLYNDTYGHLAGDECLRKIGNCFQKFGKEHSVSFYRYGGEEFVTIAYGHSKETLLQLCQDLNKAVTDLQIKHTTPQYDFISVSIGYSLRENLYSKKYEQLLFEADSALYSAKQAGRNQTKAFCDTLGEK